jgi:hypothetical protein
MWKNANLAEPCPTKAEEHGWKLVDNSFVIDWFHGNQLPESLVCLLVDDTEADTDLDENNNETQFDFSDESGYEDDE